MLCRPVEQQRSQNQQCRDRKADRIDHHQGVEILVLREYCVYPGNSGSADADGGQECRNKGDAKASQITRHDIIQQAEQICCKNDDQSGVAQ